MARVNEGGYDAKMVYRREEIRPTVHIPVGITPLHFTSYRYTFVGEPATWNSPDDIAPESLYVMHQIYAHPFAITVWISDHIEVREDPDPVIIDYGYKQVYLTHVWTENMHEPQTDKGDQ